MDVVLATPPRIDSAEVKVFKKSDFLGYSLFIDELGSITFERSMTISTINPHSFCIAQQDRMFKTALMAADVLLPDGIGIVLAKRFLSHERIKRIAGMDLFLHILKYAEDSSDLEKKRIFFVGSTPATLERIKKRIRSEYPSLEVEYYSPPFKASFSMEDNQVIFDEVRRFSPHFLFVGMTAPKQEKWSFQCRRNLKAKIVCNIGAVFDFYAGTVKRPGPFWIDLGLEWLGRFLQEPRRLWKRVLISSPRFISTVVQSKLHGM